MNERLRFNDGDRADDLRPNTMQRRENDTVPSREVNAFGRSPLQDIQLMPKRDVLYLKRDPRSEMGDVKFSLRR